MTPIQAPLTPPPPPPEAAVSPRCPISSVRCQIIIRVEREENKTLFPPFQYGGRGAPGCLSCVQRTQRQSGSLNAAEQDSLSFPREANEAAGVVRFLCHPSVFSPGLT